MADFFKIGQAAYGGGAAASKAIGEGLQKSQQIFMAYLSGQKAKREKADNITKQYLAQIPNVNAITKIPEWMRTDVNNYLVSEKQKYAEVSKRLGSMSSSDPTYMDAINELQDIKNNFAYLNDQLNQFQEDSKQYALAADNDKISEGFKLGQADKFNRTAAMYTGNAKLNIRNGNLFFNVDGKDYNYSRGEIGDYSPKNFDAQVELVNLEEQIGNDALRGRTFDSVKSKYKGKITTFLKKNGKEGALSMVFDTDPEFITGGPSLQTPEILTAIAEDNFEGKTDENGNQIPGVYDLIEDQIMTGAGTVHASIYKAPEVKTDENSTKKAQDLYNQFKQNPIGLYEQFTGVAPLYNKETGEVKIYDIDESGKKVLSFKYNLKNAPERNRFYRQLLKYSGYASGTSAGDEELRRAFDIIVGNATKQRLSAETTAENTTTKNISEPETEIIKEEVQDNANIELKPGEQGYFQQEKAKGRSAEDIRIENKAAQLINKYIQ